MAVAYNNGKVVLAAMSRASVKSAVNHSDIKDHACITMMCVVPPSI